MAFGIRPNRTMKPLIDPLTRTSTGSCLLELRFVRARDECSRIGQVVVAAVSPEDDRSAQVIRYKKI